MLGIFATARSNQFHPRGSLFIRVIRGYFPMDTYPISEEQIRFFRDSGFVQLDAVLTEDELAEIRGALDEVSGMKLTKALDRTGVSTDYNRLFTQKVNLWREHEGVRRFVMSRKLGELARKLCGASAVRLWHDHALIKPGTDSRPTPWHQDLPYWPMQQTGALSCWMALDDVDESNGCMRFIPGSHQVGRLAPIRLVDPQDIFGLVPGRTLDGVEPVVARMKAGSCTFHDGLTFHSAFTNESGRPRRAMVVIYMPDGTTYYEKPHPCTDGLGLRTGAPLAGELFPLIA